MWLRNKLKRGSSVGRSSRNCPTQIYKNLDGQKKAWRCVWWGIEQDEFHVSVGSCSRCDIQAEPRKGLQHAKGRWYQHSRCVCCVNHSFCTQLVQCLSQTRLPPAHFGAWFSRRNLEFSDWFPQTRAPPKWGGNVASSPIDTLLNALWRQFLASFFPRRLVWAQAVPVNCFHTVSVVRAQKMLFFVLHARYCQKRILSRFFLLMFCRGILDHQASQEQRDPKVMW